MKIPLTQSKYVIVGPLDYAYLIQFNWYYHHTGYAVRNIGKNPNQKTITMHQVILKRMGYKNFAKSDHINRNPLDNRRGNLRPATNSQNGYNRSKQKNNTSGYIGIIWHKRDKKWMVRIQINGKSKFLGYYSDIRDAIRVYNKAAIKHHGKFAVLNKT